jgi:hypothetical protein
MEFNKLNSLIFETLENIAPIGTSLVSMFAMEDPYYHVPYLRFRFKNKSKEDEIYKKIQGAIDSFEGNFKWELVTKVDSPNFLIIPIISVGNEKSWSDKELLISLYGESGYRERIIDCMEDIPKLANVIRSCC